MRLRPRSIRVRDTLLATLLSLLALSVVGVSIVLVFKHVAHAVVLADLERTAGRVSAAIRNGTLTNPITEDAHVDFIQVVDPQGRVTKSTAVAAGLEPISTVRPSFAADPLTVTECQERDGTCVELVAIRVTNAENSPVVYAARELPWVLVSHRIELATAGLIAALTGCAAFATWKMVGRTLGPIEAVRAQLAEISVSDLSRRVPEPYGDDEIARMAQTANETLDRLEKSVERQRQFSADAAHELRTPIAGLRVTLEDAAMHPDDTDMSATVRSALRDTGRLEAIVSDLLLLARVGTAGMMMEPVDLAELVAAAVSVRSEREIRTELASGVVVNAASSRLHRLLENLLDNAENYANSVIDVEVGREDGKAVLMVTDDGPGIPAADRERVFERFTRLDTARSRGAGGTGLGLAIARDIASAHGGTLRVEESSRGARFVLRLPLHAAL
ncbi:MAG: sensor histidine kinase [Actinomadura sp.]